MVDKYTWYSPSVPVDTADALHQVFAYGTLTDAQELVSHLGLYRAQQLFLEQPKKIYHRATLRFLTKFLLHISEPIDEDRYLKSTPRTTR